MWATPHRDATPGYTRAMARTLIEQVTDDLDGTVLDTDDGETISFSVEGRSFEMDLSNENATIFREALAPYMKVARSTSAPRTGRTRTSSSGKQRRGYDLTTIRAWAQEHGYEVAPRGRVANAVIDAFNAAH